MLALGEKVRQRLALRDAQAESVDRSRPTISTIDHHRVSRAVHSSYKGPEASAAARKLGAGLRRKMAQIAQRIASAEELYDDAATSSLMPHPVYYHVGDDVFCCDKHCQEVAAHRRALRAHGRQRLTAELQAALTWAHEHGDVLGCLHSMVDISLEVVRRSGWTALTRAELLQALGEAALATAHELRLLQRWQVASTALHEDRGAFAEHQYSKEAFVAALVAYLDRGSADFFSNPSLA